MVRWCWNMDAMYIVRGPFFLLRPANKFDLPLLLLVELEEQVTPLV